MVLIVFKTQHSYPYYVGSVAYFGFSMHIVKKKPKSKAKQTNQSKQKTRVITSVENVQTLDTSLIN